MKVQYASDLHIEFYSNKMLLQSFPLKFVGDVLVLAGDIVPFALLDKHLDFFRMLSDHFENTYWIPGNHEYYRYDLANKSGAFHEKVMNNVHLLNNKMVSVEGVEFIFSTLWTNIKEINAYDIQSRMNDFHVISDGEEVLSVKRYNALHNESVDFIREALKTTEGRKRIVVSHHVPTFMNYPERFKGDVLNDAFAVELFDLIEEYQPDYWIYGHTHSNVADFNIGKTRLLTNQFGYSQYNEHLDFKVGRCFEL